MSINIVARLTSVSWCGSCRLRESGLEKRGGCGSWPLFLDDRIVILGLIARECWACTIACFLSYLNEVLTWPASRKSSLRNWSTGYGDFDRSVGFVF